MQKRPDIKTRKKLRIAMCLLFLLQVVICTMPFIQNIDNAGNLTSASPFFMVMMLFGVVSGMTAETIKMCILCLVIILIPVLGFFFCALDKQRNLKNIVSALCCLGAVFAVLSIPRQFISLGAILAIILYVIIMFLNSVAMVMRLSRDVDDGDAKK